MDNNPTAPRVGLYLYASCAAEDYGQILALYNDDNGTPVMDIELYDLENLMDCGGDSADFPHPVLSSLEVPLGTKVVLKGIQWRMIKGDFIECRTPGPNLCFRCAHGFNLHEQKAEPWPPGRTKPVVDDPMMVHFYMLGDGSVLYWLKGKPVQRIDHRPNWYIFSQHADALGLKFQQHYKHEEVPQ